MKQNRQCELLSPAGSVAAMHAAFAAGADAVYIGGDKFGARAYADNPNERELCDAIDFAHFIDRKLYLTVNTLLKNREAREQLIPFLLPYYEAGLDGVIVQDLGVASLIRAEFPDLELHASTQMSVSGVGAARILQQYGFSRIVPARELSLEEIREIDKETGIEIECFIHGAMCYAYSGMCLMSSLIGGRSGNRGRCAGVCRLPFSVAHDGKTSGGKKEIYPLSMKDLCAVEVLPELIEAGVVSFKIEGRMKKPEYTAGITAIYRKYLDQYLAAPDQPYEVDLSDLERLTALFNRDGFQKGYYHVRNGKEMIALKNEKADHAKERSKTVQMLYSEMKQEMEKQTACIRVQADVVLKAGEAATLTLSEEKEGGLSVCRKGAVVQVAQKQPLSLERVKEQIQKTGQSCLKISSISLKADENLFMPIGQINELRREACMAFEQEKIKRAHRKKKPAASKRQEETKKSRKKAAAEYIVHAEYKEQLQNILTSEYADLLTGVALPIRRIHEYLNKGRGFFPDRLKLRACLPYIVRKDNREELLRLCREIHLLDPECQFVPRSLEGLALLMEALPPHLIVTDQGIYAMNDEAVSVLMRLGVARITAPLELNRNELMHRENSSSELIVYGRAPMMISAQCVEKTVNRCTHEGKRLRLIDRKAAGFPVACMCEDCYNIIYNSLPTSLHQEELEVFGFAAFRFELTVEDAKEAAAVFERYFSDDKGDGIPIPFTRGHFRRGVE